jgi:hypothetical protein
MPTPQDGNGPYTLDFSHATAEELRKLQRRAARRGQGTAFASAFRRIIGALRRNPNAVGEPLYRLPALRLQVRTVVVSPLLIDFAVSEDRPLVYIRSGKLLSAPDS